MPPIGAPRVGSASRFPGDSSADGKVGHPEEMVTRGSRWEGAVDEDHYDLENPLAASHQSLIYVNPEGPERQWRPDRKCS